jgi:hypothetical protein
MLIQGSRVLNSVRITQMIQTLITQIEVKTPLIFLQRTPVVFAEDEEILARFTGHTYAADIITDDAQAVTVDGGYWNFFMNSIPNIKTGIRVGQATMQRLRRLEETSTGVLADQEIVRDWEDNMALAVVTGIRQRMNAMICAMYCDNLQYDRMGVKINGSWGMPATLRVLVKPWNGAAPTPVTDILTLVQQTAPDIHGESYDRMTMSRIAFRMLAASQEFQSKVAGRILLPGNPFTQINNLQQEDMRRFAVDIFGMEIEIYDGIYYTRDSTGTRTRSRVLPTNQVIFSTKANDGDRTVMDFANGIVAESMVAGLIGAPAGIAGERVGPIAYWEGKMNPPGIECWGVSRGFPRKHRETATACMTVFPSYPAPAPAYYV